MSECDEEESVLPPLTDEEVVCLNYAKNNRTISDVKKREWSRDEQLKMILDYAKSIVENKPCGFLCGLLNSMNSNPNEYRINFSLWPKEENRK